MKLTDCSDRDLIRSILDGDADASTALYRRYLKPLYNFIYFRTCRHHQDAEDLCQNVFIDAWSSLASFDQGRDFWLWLCGIARRRLSGRYRGQKASKNTEPLPEGLDNEEPLPDVRLEDIEKRESVNLALSSLSPRHQEFLAERYVEDRSARQIGRERGLTPGAVDSVLQRARSAFKAAMKRAEKGIRHE